jgi:methionine sulfoxide reductase heme-binding subunit
MSAQAPYLASFLAHFPGFDRHGRAVPFKLLVLAICLAPAFYMAWRWSAGLLSPKPVTDILRETGDWALRFLVAALAVTPLRHATRWNKLYASRRLLGVTALAYTLAHVGFWMAHEHFRWLHLLQEAFLRTYLLVGVIATLIMIALGATSNDAGVRRLGSARWQALHWWVYPAAFASLLHYLMLIRFDATQAVLLAGLCVLFALFRLVRSARGEVRPLMFVALAVLAGLATAGVEIGYYAVDTGVDPRRVIHAQFDFSFQIRPAWWVLASGLCLAAIRAARDVWAQRAPPARQAAARSEAGAL